MNKTFGDLKWWIYKFIFNCLSGYKENFNSVEKQESEYDVIGYLLCIYIRFKKENANVLNILSGNKPTVTSKTFLEQKVQNDVWHAAADLKLKSEQGSQGTFGTAACNSSGLRGFRHSMEICPFLFLKLLEFVYLCFPSLLLSCVVWEVVSLWRLLRMTWDSPWCGRRWCSPCCSLCLVPARRGCPHTEPHHGTGFSRCYRAAWPWRGYTRVFF